MEWYFKEAKFKNQGWKVGLHTMVELRGETAIPPMVCGSLLARAWTRTGSRSEI